MVMENFKLAWVLFPQLSADISRRQDVDVVSLVHEAILDVANGIARDLPVGHVLQLVLWVHMTSTDDGGRGTQKADRVRVGASCEFEGRGSKIPKKNFGLHM